MRMSTEVKKLDTNQGKKPLLTEKRVEIIVVVFLGITAVLNAWASWIGSLHGGIQAINFTKSNNTASSATASYNTSIQLFLADMMTWNTANDYKMQAQVAEMRGDKDEAKIYRDMMDTFLKENASDYLKGFIKKMDDNMKSPFEVKGALEKYFEEPKKEFDDSRELLEEGKRDNTKGDSYHLVNVIYSVVLFLLGIIGVFKNLQSRIMVLGIALASLVFATIYMISIPMPTGFSFLNFFKI